MADLRGTEPAAEGRATLRDQDDGKASVYVELPKGSGSEWSVRIREGNCTNPGAVIEVLGVAEGGTIRTSIASPVERLRTAIVTVAPIGESDPVACGVLDWEPRPPR